MTGNEGIACKDHMDDKPYFPPQFDWRSEKKIGLFESSSRFIFPAIFSIIFQDQH